MFEKSSSVVSRLTYGTHSRFHSLLEHFLFAPVIPFIVLFCHAIETGDKGGLGLNAHLRQIYRMYLPAFYRHCQALSALPDVL